MIKNIVFDFGGVLLDWNPRYLYRQYFKTEEEMENLFAKVGLYDWNATLDAGKPFAEGVKELQDRFPEYAKEIQLFDDEWRRTVQGCFPESVALLKKLKAGGLGIYGLSNWSWEKAEGLIKEYDFFKLFDGMVISGIEKVSKPDPKIYQILLNRYHLQAEECVFIDDNAANIQAAEALGFNAIVFDDIHNVTDKLKSLIS
ncbi:MAG: HAD family phosphatase [Bacteroidales bacterium]|jgi:2-haloacid dehalogenase|nr:HAD family phosphatase [Bacteroidales bacterium]MCI2135640.1 HAD family phosphatase [Bacteroidales bacterium]